MNNFLHNFDRDYEDYLLEDDDLHDLYLVLRSHFEGSNSDEFKGRASRIFRKAFSKNISNHLDKTIEESRWALESKLGRIEDEYRKRVFSMEKILKEQLKLFGAVALVSKDEEIREVAYKLLKDNDINIHQLMQDKNGK